MAYQTYRQAEPIQVRRLAMRSPDEVNRLLEENEKLYHACIRHCIRKFPFLPQDDVIDAVNEAVTYALYHYKPEKGTLGNIMYCSAENGVLRRIKYINRKQRIPPSLHVSLDAPISKCHSEFMLRNILPTMTNMENDIVSKDLIKRWFSKLKDRERQVALLLYQGYTRSEISAKFGVTTSRIGQIVRNIRLKYERAARDGSPEAAGRK